MENNAYFVRSTHLSRTHDAIRTPARTEASTLQHTYIRDELQALWAGTSVVAHISDDRPRPNLQIFCQITSLAMSRAATDPKLLCTCTLSGYRATPRTLDAGSSILCVCVCVCGGRLTLLPMSTQEQSGL